MMTIFLRTSCDTAKTGLEKTQNDVSKELKIALRAYQNYEYGTAEPRLSTLVKLADFYGSFLGLSGGPEGHAVGVAPMWPPAGSPPRNVPPRPVGAGRRPSRCPVLL